MLFVQARSRAHEEDEKDEQDRTTESDRARERLYERETESSVGRGEKEASGKSTRWHSQDRLELYSLSLLLAFSLSLRLLRRKTIVESRAKSTRPQFAYTCRRRDFKSPAPSRSCCCRRNFIHISSHDPGVTFPELLFFFTAAAFLILGGRLCTYTCIQIRAHRRMEDCAVLADKEESRDDGIARSR